MKLQHGVPVYIGLGSSYVRGLVGHVTKISEEEVQVALAGERPPDPIEGGQPARIHYWDQDAVYTWNSRTLLPQPEGGRLLNLSLGSRGKEVTRREAHRLRLSMPFSFTVEEAAQEALKGQQFHNAKTRNISVGGLVFETGLELNVGDRLQIELWVADFSVEVLGWVIRSEPQDSSGSVTSVVAVQFSPLEPEAGSRFLGFLDSKAKDRMKDRRQFERWEVLIPCTVYRGDDVIEGRITNLSYGGALISEPSVIPPEGDTVILEFTVAGETIHLGGTLTSSVVHTTPDSIDLSESVWFGIEFRETTGEVKAKLRSVLDFLRNPPGFKGS